MHFSACNARASCASLETLILLSHIDGDVPTTSGFAAVLDGSRVGWFIGLEAAHSSIHGGEGRKKRTVLRTTPTRRLLIFDRKRRREILNYGNEALCR
jgi:hypothetical protein